MKDTNSGHISKDEHQIVIGIMSCAWQVERNKSVLYTWFPSQTIAYFLIGRPGQPPEIRDNVLLLNCKDNYEDTPQKTIAFLHFCRNFLGYSKIFKCDNDTYLSVDRLLQSDFWKNHDYAGKPCSKDGLDRFYHFGKTTKPLPPYSGPHLGSYAEGGYGYSLSQRAIDAILKFDKTFSSGEIYEDKMVGDILRLSGYELHEVQLGADGQHPAKNNYFISAHPVMPTEMLAIHSQLHS
jgi:galactosyltransferase